MIKLTIQHADQEDIGDELGPVDLSQALLAFREFPWAEQKAQSDELQLCSPGLYLEDENDGSKFFAAVLANDGIEFLLQFETGVEYEGWTLFGKRLKKRWTIIHSYDHDLASAEQAVELFFTDRKNCSC
ncbi:MAG: hypothetical protein ABIP75_15325 [Pyrinomonadaceae bacterium]